MRRVISGVKCGRGTNLIGCDGNEVGVGEEKHLGRRPGNLTGFRSSNHMQARAVFVHTGEHDL